VLISHIAIAVAGSIPCCSTFSSRRKQYRGS
jgi:hypothetical protein